MLRNEFLNIIKDSVDIEVDVDETSVLEDIEEWDSLAAVTVLALFKKHLALNVPAESLKKCKTMGDVLDLGQEKYN